MPDVEIPSCTGCSSVLCPDCRPAEDHVSVPRVQLQSWSNLIKALLQQQVICTVNGRDAAADTAARIDWWARR